MHASRQIIVGVLLLTVAGASVSQAAAQTYPRRPVRFIVPYVAGGAGDIAADVWRKAW